MTASIRQCVLMVTDTHYPVF